MIWEKPGTLTAAEWEQAHALVSLGAHAGQSDALAPWPASPACITKDWTGRATSAAAKPASSPGGADPGRRGRVSRDDPGPAASARGTEEAAAELQREVRAGRLDGDAAAAVLEVAGAGRPRRRDNLRPAGLSDREVEVARPGRGGCSNPEIAERLVISRRTAPRAAHLREGGRLEPGGPRAVRTRARPHRRHLTRRACGARRRKIGDLPMRGGPPAPRLSSVTTPTKERLRCRISANEVELNYDATGSGETLVLVHGGWSDRHNWLTVAAELARSFSVVAYDRRGHGLSQRGFQGSRRDQEDDLAALIEGLGGEPGTDGHLLQRLDRDRPCRSPPELVRSVIAHEPPLISVAADNLEVLSQFEAVQATVQGSWRGWSSETRRRGAAVRRGGRARPGRLGAAAAAAARDHGRQRPGLRRRAEGPDVGERRARRAREHRVPAADPGRRRPAWLARSLPSWPARSTAPRFTRTEAPDRAPPHPPRRLPRHGHGLPLAFARARRRGRRGCGQRRHR